MEVVSDFPADAQAAEPVQECDRPLDHPAVEEAVNAPHVKEEIISL
jgi:hypothetical protein